MRQQLWSIVLVLFCAPLAWCEAPVPWPILTPSTDSEPLPGTESLDWKGDFAARMVAGVDKFLLREIEASNNKRQLHWHRDTSSAEAYSKSVEPNRHRLADILGVSRDARPSNPNFEYIDSIPGPRAETQDFVIHRVRWQAFRDVHGIGLLLEPRDEPVANVIAIPDASQTPEEIGFPPSNKSQTNAYAFQLARLGCRVLVPLLIDRTDNKYRMSNREYLHRSAFILGRTLAGYEVQKVSSGVDCLLSMPSSDNKPLGVVGWGEGGRIGLYAAALDTRLDGACVSGYFAPREEVWNEPADRSLFGLLREFGDAEIGSLASGRMLFVENSSYPHYSFRANKNGELEALEEYSDKNGKPGKLLVPNKLQVQTEFMRLQQLAGAGSEFDLINAERPLADATLVRWLRNLRHQAFRKSLLEIQEDKKEEILDRFKNSNRKAWLQEQALSDALKITYANVVYSDAHIAQRHANQVAEIDRHNQWALVDSPRIRMEKFANLNADSLDAYQESILPFRKEFRDKVIGNFDQPLLPANVRSRKYQEGPKTISYEVVLDVFPDIFAYGILTVPKSLDLTANERRPVVVCQHGLEGRPQDVVSESGFDYYKAFATRLAERGFITFAPQNIYIGYDRFRTLQFKAYSLGCTLYSIMVPQHEQITNWLAELPFVDPKRIAFYGLSYGGKSAMRIPALVDKYCLSICSGDFDDWVWKNASTDPRSLRYSYANKGEYEMYEFNLGGTFNYAEMAALICPRPFMVERGHFDGVAPDEAVAYEYAKVRHLYQAQLGIGDRTKIEWFVGPHAINGKGTFAFLHKQLDWPDPAE